jgi:hypothetical protein
MIVAEKVYQVLGRPSLSPTFIPVALMIWLIQAKTLFSQVAKL